MSENADSADRPWTATIGAAGRGIDLGGHATAGEAARAYDRAAREHFGDLARPNVPEEPEPDG